LNLEEYERKKYSIPLIKGWRDYPEQEIDNLEKEVVQDFVHLEKCHVVLFL